VTCLRCRADNSAGRRFCGSARCQQRRLHSSRRPTPTPPKHLAEKILTSKAALEGERKQVTLLFADLKGQAGRLA